MCRLKYMYRNHLKLSVHLNLLASSLHHSFNPSKLAIADLKLTAGLLEIVKRCHGSLVYQHVYNKENVRKLADLVCCTMLLQMLKISHVQMFAD